MRAAFSRRSATKLGKTSETATMKEVTPKLDNFFQSHGLANSLRHTVTFY